ncbi:hypothetical protein JXR93_00400 [bacterium]|nr:hypothetical protein [bacterium]
MKNRYFENWINYHKIDCNSLDVLKGDSEISKFYKNSYHLKDFNKQSEMVFNNISTIIENELSFLKQ